MMSNSTYFVLFHISVLFYVLCIRSSLAAVRSRVITPGMSTRPDNIAGENIVIDGRTKYVSIQSEQFDRDPELSDELFKEWEEAQEKELWHTNVHQIPISTFRPNITFAEDRMRYMIPTDVPAINSTKSAEVSASSSSELHFHLNFSLITVFLCFMFVFEFVKLNNL